MLTYTQRSSTTPLRKPGPGQVNLIPTFLEAEIARERGVSCLLIKAGIGYQGKELWAACDKEREKRRKEEEKPNMDVIANAHF
jgi:hypothetical protein